MAQVNYKTEILEDVAIRLERASIDRTTGTWSTASGTTVQTLVIDNAEIQRQLEAVRVDVGQEGIMAEEVVKGGFEISISSKTQIDDNAAGGLQYEIEAAGGGFWRWWFVYVFQGGSWIVYQSVLKNYNIKLGNPSEVSLQFGPGRR
jgi:hypothetical protein